MFIFLTFKECCSFIIEPFHESMAASSNVCRIFNFSLYEVAISFLSVTVGASRI